MRLAACYNVWNEEELLKHSTNNIRPLVDVVIIVYSNTSNFGEKTSSDMLGDYRFDFGDGLADVYYRQMEPDLKKSPRDNETDKRNFGLQVARELGCTHFLSMDADEFYDPEEFLKAKEVAKTCDGIVCSCTTYFRRPTLCIGLDVTLVPHIHLLTSTIKHEFNRNYPFAWDKNQIRIDPTRSLNITSGVHLSDITMHHFSWVRSDFKRKIRNSTAKVNLERSTIWEDLRLAKDGYFVKFYQKHLTTVPNRFNIPDYGDLDEILHKSDQPLAPDYKAT